MRQTSRFAQFVVATLVLSLVAGSGVAWAQDPVLQKLVGREATSLRTAQFAFDRFDEQLKTLEAKTAFTAAEVEALRSRAEEVKRVLPGMQATLNSFVTKLRSNGLWTADFDARALNELKRAGNAQLIREITEEGGARAAIQNLLADFNKIPSELDQAVAKFRGRTALQRLMDSVLGTPAEAKVWAMVKTAARVVALMAYCTVCTCAYINKSSIC